MKIEKIDIVLICVCALAGSAFLMVASGGNISASLIAGIPSGAGGGCVASIFRRVIKRNAKQQIDMGTEPEN